MEKHNMLKSTAFGGFEKKSVLNYIYEINSAAKEAQEKLSAQLDEITTSREKLSDTLKQLEKKMQGVESERDNLTTELVKEQERTGQFGKIIETLNGEIAKQEQIICDREQEIANYKRLNTELVEKNQELEGRRQEIEKASAYVGELLLRTRSDSERILEDAQRKAETLVSEAGKSLERVHTQFAQFRNELDNIQGQIKDAMGAVQKQFDGIGDAVSEVEESLRVIIQPSKIDLTKHPVQPEPELEVDISESVLQDPDDGQFFRPAAER